MTKEDIFEARQISKKMHPSRRWLPLTLIETKQEVGHLWTYWENDLYSASVRAYEFGSRLRDINASDKITYIGVCNADGSARHDWRDLQHIKNQICGEEWEALELYPAESRLVDTSNLFILWCFPRIPIGMQHRAICNPANAIAPQRGWHPEDEPKIKASWI